MLCHDVGNPIGMWIRRRKGRILKVSIDHLNIRIPEKRCQNQLLKYSIASKVLTYSGIIVAKSSTASNSLTSTLTKLQSQFWTKDFQIASRRQNLSESFQINWSFTATKIKKLKGDFLLTFKTVQLTGILCHHRRLRSFGLKWHNLRCKLRH